MILDVRGLRFHCRRGFLLIEVLLGIGIFAIFLGAVSMVVLRGQESSELAGDRVRGLYASLRGLEASRAIRDTSFASLTVGPHGIANALTGWSFSGTKSTISGAYATQVVVTSLGTGWNSVVANTSWKHGRFASGSVLLRTELTNWRGTGTVGDWSSAVLDQSYIASGSPLFTGMAIAGNTVYITGDTASGGAGLYVLDISGIASGPPTRIAGSFTLGTPGIAAAVKGNVLYLITGSITQEVRVYNVTTPASPTLLTSYNLSGSSLAASMALNGNMLYVGAAQNASYKELYSFDVSNTGAVLYKAAIEQNAAIRAIAINGDEAFLATDDPNAEMKRVYVANSGTLLNQPQGSYNLTSTEIGRGIAVSGTSAILGRARGTSTQEMVLLDTTGNGGPPISSPGPWYHEGSGSLLGVATDPFNCYVFLAADSGGKAFQTVDLRNLTSLPELSYYSTSPTVGPGRAILYDPIRDRVFLLTKNALLIFRPGGPTPGICG